MSAPHVQPRGSAAPGRAWIRWIGVIGVVVLVVIAGRELAGYIPRFARWVEGMGTPGAIAFIAGYALATIAFVPGSLLTLAAGAVFGIAKGTLLVFIGATLGETAAFLIARYVARAAVERRIARDARFVSLDRAIAEEGRKIVLLLRLSPVFPFNLLNYALGLTRIRLVDYLIASLGILPGTLLYVYSGKVAGDVAAIASGAAVPKSDAYYVVLAIGLLATIAVTVWIARLARNALKQSL